jgi:hypothetical protein
MEEVNGEANYRNPNSCVTILMSNNDTSDSSEFGTPFQALIDHCEANDLSFATFPEEKRIRLNICRKHALYTCQLRISNDDEIFQIHLNYPVLAKDEKMRPSVTEFFTRVNYGLVLGAFEVDLRDGEARYHISHLVGDGRLEDEVIRRIIGSALSTADRYFPAYMRVLFGGDTPEDAVFLAELDLNTQETENEPASAETPAPPARKPSASKRKPRKKRGKLGNSDSPEI